MAEKWIKKALPKSSKGKLHRELGVPEGKKIPAKKLAKAAKSSNPKVRKQVALAKTLGKMHKNHKKG
jgi:hypothetical protein